MDILSMALALSGGNGSGGASSWNDLTDKPFGEEVTTLIEVTDGAFADMGGMFAYMLSAPLDLTDGETYTVLWDGVEYKRAAMVIGPAGQGLAVLGNASVFGEADTGEPFAYAYNSQMGMVVMCDVFGTAETTHSFAIMAETVHKLDVKYLPDGYPYEEIKVVNEPLNITWDGNTDGLLCVGDNLYKISDLVLTHEQIKSVTETGSNGYVAVVADDWDGMVDRGEALPDIVFTPWCTYVSKDGVDAYDCVYPESGIYAYSASSVYPTSITSTEPVEQSKTVVKKLDIKYLPELPDVVFTEEDTGTGYAFKCNYSYNELLEIIANGTIATKIPVRMVAIRLDRDGTASKMYNAVLDYFELYSNLGYIVFDFYRVPYTDDRSYCIIYRASGEIVRN